MNWLTLIPVAISLILAGFNAAIFLIIKLNDMKHLGDSMQRIETKINEMDKKIDNQGERIACLEGRIKTKKK